MKILVFTFAMLLPFCIYGSNEKVENVVINHNETTEYNVWATVQLSVSDIALPLTIKVPAPSETVIGISGPCKPSITNWTVENGYLTITYTNRTEIFELTSGGTFYIEVATDPMMYYAIELIVTD